MEVLEKGRDEGTQRSREGRGHAAGGLDIEDFCMVMCSASSSFALHLKPPPSCSSSYHIPRRREDIHPRCKHYIKRFLGLSVTIQLTSHPATFIQST
jgi:hypothetical protein